MNIRHFYKDKKILLTGGSGFIGKIMIQKLLYSFPELGCIYLIMRSKKEKTPRQRFETEILNCPCFSRLQNIHKEKYKQFMSSKIVVMNGDVEEPNLGLNNHDYMTIINDCQIFFANAANIKFDAHLDLQIKANIQATLTVLQLSQKANAEVFVHTSTFAVNFNKAGYMKEKLYELEDVNGYIKDPETLYSELKRMSRQELRDSAKQILRNYQYPNQYSFTKGLCEKLVESRRGITPTVILRPSMVYSTYKQPFPGWIDVVHGGQITFLFIGLGLFQQFPLDPYMQIDTVPGDLVVNNLIVSAAYQAGRNNLTVYNVSSIERNPILWKQMISITVQFWKKYPTPKRIDVPKAIISSNTLYLGLHYLRRQLVLWMYINLGYIWYCRNPEMRQKIKRVERLNEKAKMVGKIYGKTWDNFWVQETKQVQSIRQWLGSENQNWLVDCADINMLYYFLLNNYGLKKYLLKEPIEQIPSIILESDRIQLCTNNKAKL